jgi:hypothetical protein
MIGTDFVNRLAITTRRKAFTTAVVYGLSLAVRFTSAAGEEVELPAQSAQRIHPVFSIMTSGSAQLPYQSLSPNFARPIVFRQGWPMSSAAASAPGCVQP